MLRLWKIAPDWQSGRAKLSTWLYQVVANLCKDRCRKPPMTALEGAPEPIDSHLAVESLLARGRRQLKTCLEAEISALGYRDEKI